MVSDACLVMHTMDRLVKKDHRELSAGTQLAVIFLHESVHGVHHETGVTDHTPPRIAHSRETDALLDFFATNPLAAGWWFWLLQPRPVGLTPYRSPQAADESGRRLRS